VTPANLSEQKQLDHMVQGLAKHVRVQTDKGFFSAKNKNIYVIRGSKMV